MAIIFYPLQEMKMDFANMLFSDEIPPETDGNDLPPTDKRSLKKSPPTMTTSLQALERQAWAILDVEYVQVDATHQCIRKLAIILHNGHLFVREFTPCRSFYSLENTYKRAFSFCKENIHHLSYKPSKSPHKCNEAVYYLSEILAWNGISCVFYKGGTIERDICSILNIQSYNLEELDVPKAPNHKPEEEVQFFRNFFV